MVSKFLVDFRYAKLQIIRIKTHLRSGQVMERPSSRHEPVIWVLGINSGLEGPAVQLNVVLSDAELFASGHLRIKCQYRAHNL